MMIYRERRPIRPSLVGLFWLSYGAAVCVAYGALIQWAIEKAGGM